MPTRTVTGIREIDRKLDKLSRSEANKVAKSAINAGLTVLTTSIRKNIDAEPISSELKKALKSTVGKRLETGGKAIKNGATAKAGFGVGKNTRARALRAAKRKAARGEKKGVGISANNVQWFALGTGRRFTQSPRRYVGAIAPVRAVRRAGQSSGGQLRSVITAKARERLEALAKSL